ncbi:MAG: hypothetical protein ACRDWG_21805 [Actinomycetes bacterium]|jgi:hypothetical protein|nr:hypothetical protein [Actinomycetes bacterium]
MRVALAAGAVSLLGRLLGNPEREGGGSGGDDYVFWWAVVLLIALALAATVVVIVALRRGQDPPQQDHRLETPEADLAPGSSQSGSGQASGDPKVRGPGSESLAVSIS